MILHDFSNTVIVCFRLQYVLLVANASYAISHTPGFCAEGFSFWRLVIHFGMKHGLLVRTFSEWMAPSTLSRTRLH